LEWFIKNYSIFGTMFAPYSGAVKSMTCNLAKERIMETLSIHRLSAATYALALRSLAGIGAALLVAALFGALLSCDWTLSMDPVVAATFTA
jgi:hypothetical protein